MNYVPGRYIYSKVYNMSDHNCVKVLNTSFSCFYDMEVNLCKVSFSVTSCLNLKFKAHTVNIVKWYYDATNCFDKLYGLTVCVERETERGRERQTERDRERQRQRERQKERDRERFNSQNMSCISLNMACISLNKMIHKPSCQYFLYPW